MIITDPVKGTTYITRNPLGEDELERARASRERQAQHDKEYTVQDIKALQFSRSAYRRRYRKR
jgi:hypothetical protein